MDLSLIWRHKLIYMQSNQIVTSHQEQTHSPCDSVTMVPSKLSVLTPVKVNSSSKNKGKKKRCNALRTGARIGTLEVDQSWSRYKRNIGVWKLSKQNDYIIHLRLSVRLSIFCHCKNYFSQAEFSKKGSFQCSTCLRGLVALFTQRQKNKPYLQK